MTRITRRARPGRRAQAAAAMTVLLSLAAAGWTPAVAAGPNTVAQWNKIAEDTVVGSGAFQNEGWIYMAYESAAVFDAVVAIDGGYEPYAPAFAAPAGASADAAVVQAAYEVARSRTSRPPRPASAPRTRPRWAPSRPARRRPTARPSGTPPPTILTGAHGRRPADADRHDLGVPDEAPGPGVWRLTPAVCGPADAMGRDR